MTDGIWVRAAITDDVEAIVALLHDDVLGRGREDLHDIELYRRAFVEIAADPSEHLVVVEVDGHGVVGTMQVSVLPGVSRRATRRLQIEGVRVSSALRGRGIGDAMIGWAIERARELGCDLVQLTSDRRRHDAQRFYERLGFEPSHIGFKLDLSSHDR